VVKSRDRSRFSQKSFLRLRFIRLCTMQQLEGDMSPQAGVLCLIDGSHATFAKEPHNPVMEEGLP
jgi:hypothetical protein